MGYTLAQILADFEDFKNNLDYFLDCIGYTATDIENDILTLKAKIIEANEESQEE